MGKKLSKYLDPKLLAALSSMEVRARAVVEGFVSGLHKSPYKGFNIEFAEYRQYTHGDSMKDIDWKVYGRTDKYYIKEHEEETNLSGFLIMDTSGSMAYKGEGNLSKLDYAATLAASLAYLMLRQQDSVGLITFAQNIRKVIPPKTGMSHLKAICRELEETNPSENTNVASALDRAGQIMHKRGLFVIFSDLMDSLDAIIAKARQLRARRHEVLIFHILDRNELSFPFEDFILFKDLEDASTISADAFSLRKEYLRKIRNMVNTLQSALRKGGVDYLLTDTSRPLEGSLRSFFSRRQAAGSGLL